MENILFAIITISFLMLMFAHVYQTNKFFLQLKRMHQDVWKDLGKPQWRIHFGDDSFQIAMKYIRQKKFSHLEDSTLESIYKKIKNIEYIAIGLAVLIFVATIIDIVWEG
ncbi:MAG: hypothetical protein COA44_05525 [Arcobacter sp.]|nr:MAG: hypothetical protein COA44_05525 [Arcobacter sp.]